MDVNRADAVTPVGTGGGPKQERKRDSEDDKHDKGGKTDETQAAQSPWTGTEAFAVDGMLATSMTPEIQKIVDGLVRQIEPLRAEVERARGREAHFKELAEKHSFLPVPGRREFLRELAHVLNNMQHLTPPPNLAVLHIANADELRRRDGRQALDGLLSHVCQVLDGMLHPTDVVGSLGGNDFGVILLVGNGDRAHAKAREMEDAVHNTPFTGAGGPFAIEAVTGVATLASASNADAALVAADRDLVNRLQGPGATTGGNAAAGD
ncbi:MAG TPA: GGDEF domain-containing protein [Rhodospirillales bacterium]